MIRYTRCGWGSYLLRSLVMLGPVFAWELVRAGRRRWHWWARVLYVCLLLVFLYLTFGDVTRFRTISQYQNHQILSEIGARFYRGFSFYQLLAVLLLAPIYAATSVSEEKTRRTLPYLLASRLRDSEIVLGKIALAVLRVWEVLLCGLPLCAMCLLLGGVTPEFMFLDFLVAMAAAWASCALGVLAAMLGRRLSEALLLVLLIQMLWYVLPVVDFVARAGGTGFYIPSELLDMNAFRAIYRGQLTGVISRWDSYAGCLLATSLFSVSLSLVAWWILRPAWQREEERRPVRSLLSPLRRTRPAQRVWDQPFLWRELRSRSSTAIDRIVWALYLVVSIGVLTGIAVNWVATVQIIRTSTGMVAAAPLLDDRGFLGVPLSGAVGVAVPWHHGGNRICRGARRQPLRSALHYAVGPVPPGSCQGGAAGLRWPRDPGASAAARGPAPGHGLVHALGDGAGDASLPLGRRLFPDAGNGTGHSPGQDEPGHRAHTRGAVALHGGRSGFDQLFRGSCGGTVNHEQYSHALHVSSNRRQRCGAGEPAWADDDRRVSRALPLLHADVRPWRRLHVLLGPLAGAPLVFGQCPLALLRHYGIGRISLRQSARSNTLAFSTAEERSQFVKLNVASGPVFASRETGLAFDPPQGYDWFALVSCSK